MSCFSLRRALVNSFQIPFRSSKSIAQTTTFSNSISAFFKPRDGAQFSTSAVRAASKKNQKGKGPSKDRRITMIRYSLYHPTTLMPRPLRFSRNRALRHWTIHRAWNLYRANLRKARQLELERQYNAMAAANEELRLGAGDGGKLFRRAQMKTGVWSIPERGGGIPIEYARPPAEWMGTTGSMGTGNDAKIWDTNWRRPG